MISICIIAKNEAGRIEHCLERLSHLGYEIVVTDTGSTDDTKKIAKMYTDCVYEFEWVDDFALARNFCAYKATNDMVMFVDADEYLINFDKVQFESELKTHSDYIGKITNNIVMNYNGKKTISKSSLARVYNRNLYHYVGIVHEQIARICHDNEPILYYDLPVEFEHFGYDQSLEQKKKKANFYLKLLEIENKKNPNNPYTLYQMGKSYVYIQDYAKAYDYFKGVMDYDLNPKTDWVLTLVLMYAQVLMKLSKYDEAMQMLNIYDEFSYSPDYVATMGNILFNCKLYDDALVLYNTVLKSDIPMLYDNIRNVSYNMGNIYLAKGDKQGAIKYFKDALPLGVAKKALSKLGIVS